jgi:hypothetical protein
MALFGGKKAGKDSAVDTDWADNGVTDAPRTGTDDYKKLRRKKNFYKLYVWSASALFLPVLASNFIIAGNFLADDEEPVITTDSPRKGRAIVEVENWLGTNPEPVPGGQFLSWNSVDKLPDKPLEKNEEPPADPPVVEVHRLTVASESGALFDVDVQLATTKAEGTAVVAGPSLIPQPPEGRSSSTNDASAWPSLESASIPEQGETAVQTWAQAFTSGDPDQLRIAVGDPDANAAYVPLSGVTVDSISLQEAGLRTMTDDSDDPQPDLITAQVRLVLDWDGMQPEDAEAVANTDEPSDEPTGAAEADDRVTQHVDYDVLITGASTASPRVVAWGGPGSGINLQPYDNGLEGRQLRSGDSFDYASDDPADPGAATEGPADEPADDDTDVPAEDEAPDVDNETED